MTAAFMRLYPRTFAVVRDLWRRHGVEAALAAAIVTATGILTAVLTGRGAAAAACNGFLFVIVPLVCLIAFWAGLGEETTVTRAGQAIARLFGLDFCIVLPASDSHYAAQARLEAVLAKGMGIVFLGALAAAVVVRLAGWRLRRTAIKGEQTMAPDRVRQFRLRDLFGVMTTVCVLLALGGATQRAYGTSIEELVLFDHLRVASSLLVSAAAVVGIGALAIFCLWFRNFGQGRSWLLLIHVAAWMSITALSFAFGSALNLKPEPSLHWLLLGSWVILFLPMTVASHVSQACGWRFARTRSAQERPRGQPSRIERRRS